MRRATEGWGRNVLGRGRGLSPGGSWQSWRPARPRSTKFKTLKIRTTRERPLQPGKTHENHRGTLLSYELTVSHQPLHLRKGESVSRLPGRDFQEKAGSSNTPRDARPGPEPEPDPYRCRCVTPVSRAGMEEQGRGPRSSSEPCPASSLAIQGSSTGEGEELRELQDNVGTSINVCKRLQIKGGEEEIGRFLLTGRDKHRPDA